MIGDILQPTHLLFILVVALLVLGPKRLPEVGRSLGRGMRDFRNALSSDDHHDEVGTGPSAPTDYTAPERVVMPEPVVTPERVVAPEPVVGPEAVAVPEPEPATEPQPAATAEPEAEPAKPAS